MRFIYQKEFVAQRAGADAVAALYRTRGLSTDTAVEAGYVVYNGLGIVRALDPERRIRRVLIVGPGLDLAPRTGLLEAGPPESYQPWAVIDALLALGLSRADDLQVVGADINSRVVEHLARSRAAPPVLTLVSEIGESDTIKLSAEYRDYFAATRRRDRHSRTGPVQRTTSGHLGKTVAGRCQGGLGPDAPPPLDIVTEHLEVPAFDLIIATNILPYFDDIQLMLAIGNISRMLAPGGVFLHNEARPDARGNHRGTRTGVRAVASGRHRDSPRSGAARRTACGSIGGRRGNSYRYSHQFQLPVARLRQPNSREADAEPNLETVQRETEPYNSYNHITL